MDATIRFTEEQWSALQSGLWSRTDVETGAIVFVEAAPSEGSASLAVRTVTLVPDDAYRSRKPDFMEIDPVWMNAQCFAARRRGLSVFTVHTHLSNGAAWFSWADDEGDRRLMPALAAQMPDQLHGSLNVTQADAVARVYVEGALRPARISVSGTRLLTLPDCSRKASATEEATHSRQQLALGRDGHRRLRALRVGVVGLGGTGSVVCALLGHLGVARLVLLDGDIVETTNLSRVLESQPADVVAKVPKTEIARRALERGVPDASVSTVTRPLAHWADVACLAECDVIFSCVDRLSPRALLNRLSYAAHIPLIDMGSAFRVDARGEVVSQGGKVVIVGPGRPCLWCWGDLDAERIRVESLSRDERENEAEFGYITGADEPHPSVVTFNATLASAAVTELLRIVTGFAGNEPLPDRINFNFARGAATRARGLARPDCSFCGGLSTKGPPGASLRRV